MKRISLFACLVLILIFVMNVSAADLPQRAMGHESVFHGGSAEFSKTDGDTILLIGPWGSGAQVNGQFESPSGNPSWNGWTHHDSTQPTETHWHVSDYSASNLPGGAGNLAAYCGEENIPSCDNLDPVGGYGNNYVDILEYSYVVDDASAECTMIVSGVMNSNTEPGYDYVTFQFVTADGSVVAEAFEGIHESWSFGFIHYYSSEDYVGANSDEVRFQILVTSDGGWSDEDCNYWSNGACQIDDLLVQCDNGGNHYFTDFEDGTLGQWNHVLPQGVGDFAGLWAGLEDLDPCRSNYSYQVAFINDGHQVPGVGPSPCISWCYGPGGYIVNTTGGAVDGGYLSNLVESPVLIWPGSDYTGAQMDFDVYRHEDLSPNSPGIFYSWHVRSTADEEAYPIASQAWQGRTFVYYGGPDYVRSQSTVSDILAPGVTHVQVQLSCLEIGYVWGFTGDDGYPAPYFDNVRFASYQTMGPAMSTREIDLAQDNFTAIGESVDMNNPAINNVRFDSAQSKAVGSEEHNIPGDSITCRVASIRDGGQLIYNRLVYTMQRNPVFNSVRDPYWGVSGTTDGIQQGLTDKYYYDLPDSGFLFPGDILHYYFEAIDEVAHTDPQTSTLPADISGFGDFSGPTAYHSSFQVHALPSIDSNGEQPPILFWNDFGNRGGEEEWYTSLTNIGMEVGRDYDVYYTNGPSSGVGNGLGGRAVYEQIKSYTDLLYTSGDLGVYTIANGDFNMDPSRDIQLLTDWFAFGEERDALLCGDNLVSDLVSTGSIASGFVNDLMNVQLESSNLRPLINSQSTPLVLPEPDNIIFFTTGGWIAYGGCMGINSFDAVTAGTGAERLARFTNPSGAAEYIYSAATLNETDMGNRIISLPYDLMYIYTDQNHPVGGGVSARTNVLKEILYYFTITGYLPSEVTPDAGSFSTANYPNPFNPATKIEFNLPKTGHLTLKIYNVRGELVKTLIDETREAGPDHIMWDGTNSQDSSVASGIYFYEARTGGEVQINKMTLVK